MPEHHLGRSDILFLSMSGCNRLQSVVSFYRRIEHLLSREIDVISYRLLPLLLAFPLAFHTTHESPPVLLILFLLVRCESSVFGVRARSMCLRPRVPVNRIGIDANSKP